MENSVRLNQAWDGLEVSPEPQRRGVTPLGHGHGKGHHGLGPLQFKKPLQGLEQGQVNGLAFFSFGMGQEHRFGLFRGIVHFQSEP